MIPGSNNLVTAAFTSYETDGTMNVTVDVSADLTNISDAVNTQSITIPVVTDNMIGQLNNGNVKEVDIIVNLPSRFRRIHYN